MRPMPRFRRRPGELSRETESTIRALARTLAARDLDTADHSGRVARLTALLAEELGFSEREREAARIGALVHDVGKIGVPDSVLLKPGPLDAEEFAHIRRHPEISCQILAELALPEIVGQMARSHHERFDGDGYPDGLAGEAIPLAARVLAVADALDAMTSHRPYRPALSLTDAIAEVERSTPAQFCPRVVAALRRCLARGEAVAALSGV